METIELKVAGMTCASCANSVSKALKRVAGVQDVHVDLARGGWIARAVRRVAQQREVVESVEPAPRCLIALGEKTRPALQRLAGGLVIGCAVHEEEQ